MATPDPGEQHVNGPPPPEQPHRPAEPGRTWYTAAALDRAHNHGERST